MDYQINRQGNETFEFRWRGTIMNIEKDFSKRKSRRELRSKDERFSNAGIRKC